MGLQKIKYKLTTIATVAESYQPVMRKKMKRASHKEKRVKKK